MTTYPRTEIARIQSRLNDNVAAIRNSRDYTDRGKRAEIDRLVREARTQADKLKTEHITKRESRRATLEKIIFGIPGEPTADQIIIQRDSRDRAAKIKMPADARKQLTAAQRSGDHAMAQAIALVASQNGWREILDAYAEQAPAGTRASLDELAELPSGPRTTFSDNAVFTIREPADHGVRRTDRRDNAAFITSGQAAH